MIITQGMVIRCKTYEEACALCLEVIKDKPLFQVNTWKNYWNIYKENTCYEINKKGDNFTSYGTTDSYKKYNEEIYLYSDLFNETTDNNEVLQNMSKVDLAVFERNKAIDKFVEKLINRLEQESYTATMLNEKVKYLNLQSTKNIIKELSEKYKKIKFDK